MIILFFAMLTGITFLLCLTFKERFGYLIPASIIIPSFLLYFSQILFHTFMIGMIISVLAGIAGILLCAGCCLSNKKGSSALICSPDFFFSPGFYAFIIIFLYAFIAYNGRHFSAWDEMSHWGHMVKEMVRLDRFYIVPEAREMSHKDYPPIIQIFEYIVCRFSGGYSEGSSSFGIQLIILSFIVPLFTELFYTSKEKKKFKYPMAASLIMLIVILLFLCFDPEDIYRTIMVDCAVSAVGAYSLILALDDDLVHKKGRLLCLLLTMAYLPLCKQIGLAFVLLTGFAFFIGAVQNRKNKSFGVRIILLLIMMVLPLISLIIWAKVIEPYHFSAQFDLSAINPKEVFGILIGHGSWEQHFTYMSYLTSLLCVPLTTGPVSMSYFTSGIVGMVLMLFILRLRSKNIQDNERIIRYILVLIAGMIGYAFTMLVMYMYGFSEGEMLGLASFSRYMNIYVICMYLILLSVFIENRSSGQSGDGKTAAFSCKYGFGFLGALVVALLIFVGQDRLPDLLPKLYGNETREYQELAKDIDSYVQYDDKVLLISNNNTVYYPFLRYYCDNAILSGNVYYSTIRDDELKAYDYVYVINSDELIYSVWHPLMTDQTEDLTPGMYRIDDTDGSYRIEKIG